MFVFAIYGILKRLWTHLIITLVSSIILFYNCTRNRIRLPWDWDCEILFDLTQAIKFGLSIRSSAQLCQYTKGRIIQVDLESKPFSPILNKVPVIW